MRGAVDGGGAQLKNWRTLTSRSRSDLRRSATDPQAVVGRQKRNEQFAERQLSFDRIKAAVSE